MSIDKECLSIDYSAQKLRKWLPHTTFYLRFMKSCANSQLLWSMKSGPGIIYIKAIWVIDQVGLQVGLRALNGRGRMNSMWKSQLKP